MLLSLRNFVFASFIIFEKTRRKPGKRRVPEKFEWFHDHGKIVLKIHKIVPRGGLSIFLPRGRSFAKIFCPGAGNLTTLNKFPGGQPGCWCLELTDALSPVHSKNRNKALKEPQQLWDLRNFKWNLLFSPNEHSVQC